MITRAISGLILVTVMLCILLGYPGMFSVFWGFVMVIAYLEGLKFSRYSKGLRRIYLASALMWMLSLSAASSMDSLTHFVVLPLLSLFVFLMASIFLYEGEHDFYFFYDFCGLFSTFIYISMFYTPIFYLASRPDSVEILLFLFGLMWIQDTLAYFFGKAFGKRKLAVSLSPKKTWEGSVLGLLGAYFCLWPIQLSFEIQVQNYLLVFVILVGIAGQVGDLLESFYKRNFGVKDSGSILPGHGGVLDRFDSVTAGSIVYLALNAFLNAL